MVKESQKRADKAYNERQKKKGIRIRTFRLSDNEFIKIKEFLNNLRKIKQ